MERDERKGDGDPRAEQMVDLMRLLKNRGEGRGLNGGGVKQVTSVPCNPPSHRSLPPPLPSPCAPPAGSHGNALIPPPGEQPLHLTRVCNPISEIKES